MMLQDRALAEDAVQETFLKAYRNLDTFRCESSEKTWLTRIAVNVCHDLRKSAWSRFVNRAVVPEDLPITGSDAFKQEKLDLAMAIFQLPDKYRKVILLRYYQELSVTEISEIAGVSASMISRRIRKAHARMHAILGKEYLYE